MGNSMLKATNQYLTFTLGSEVFAVDIGMVREVLEMTTVTRIPRTPEFICGVINLRGHAVPVVDMRIKFGMPQGSKTVDTCIIVVEIEWGGELHAMGAMVDSVQEVRELAEGSISPPPQVGAAINTEFIKGMGHHDDYFILILDMDKVFSVDEIAIAAGLNAEAKPGNSEQIAASI